jgi:predicted amidohydrolase YtcJ
MVPGPGSQQVLDSLRTLVALLPANTWLQGEIGLRVLHDPQLRRTALDQVAPHHPVRPSGLLNEYAQWNTQRAFNSAQPDEIWVPVFRQYSAQALQYGITSVQNMADGLAPNTMMRVLQASRLPLRMRLIPMPATTAQGRLTREWNKVYQGAMPLVRVEGRKWILDATPLEGGALMRRAYPGRPKWHGQLNFPVDTIRQILREGLATKEPLMLHIVGDSTAKLVLKLMSELADDAIWQQKRVRFEHGDGLAADLHPRARALGVVVVQNPSHFVNPTVDKINGAPAMVVNPSFRSLLTAGIPLALGSDGPQNPFLNILFASTLANEKEALSREQAVTAYTAGAAYAEFAEQDKGTLMPGKLADLAVLSQDIFTVPPPALPATVSELTMIGGKVVYEVKTISKR